MGFKSVENDSGLMQEGEYEVYVHDCCETKTKSSGMDCIKFDFVVRADVDQKYKNKHIFKNFYKDKETGEWPNEKIGKYANALGIEKGTEFDLDDLIGRNCRAVIRHFTGGDGVKREAIFYLKPSSAGEYIAKLPGSDLTELDDLDEDLPF